MRGSVPASISIYNYLAGNVAEELPKRFHPMAMHTRYINLYCAAFLVCLAASQGNVYNTTTTRSNDLLNVHLVPHSHDDLGKRVCSLSDACLLARQEPPRCLIRVAKVRR